ncbi:MAG: pitrilysin family protein [bacterium]|nr:pitrilysin family protein [bacterium]
MVSKKTLQNGLRVLAVPRENTESVTVLVLVGAGVKHEEKRISGVSHFLEHMLFKGTKNLPTPLAVADVIDRVGGSCNAFTSEEHTGYYAKVDSRHTDLALEWVADIFLRSTFPSPEMKRERGVVIEEMHMQHDDPKDWIHTLWHSLLYGDQPAGWNILGTEDSVRGLSRKDILLYQQSMYVPSGTVVCVAGKVSAPEVFSKVGKLFKSMGSAPLVSRSKTKEQQYTPALFLEHRETAQTHLALGVRGFALHDPRRYDLLLAATLLGGMMSSRLFTEIREKLGLAYSVGTGNEMDTDSGFFVTMAGVKNEGAEKAIRVILREYKRMTTELVSASDLRKIKEYEIGKTTLQLESSGSLAQFVATQELLEKRILTPEEVYDMIQRVTARSIQRVAREIFRNERLNLAIIGPFQDKKPFQRILHV